MNPAADGAADRGLAASSGSHSVGVTIELPEPYGSELTVWRARLGDPSAAKIPPHITLLPPTNASGPVIATFIDHLAEVAAAHQPFTIRLSGTGSFRPVSPVVFVSVVEGAEGCTRVQSAVRSGPIVRELHFPYHPHVTVAHDVPEPRLDFAMTALAEFEAEFQAEGFALFERDRDGYWHPGQEFRFGGPDGD